MALMFGMIPAVAKQPINAFELKNDRALADAMETHFLNQYNWIRWAEHVLDPWVRLYKGLYDLGWRPDTEKGSN